MPIIEFPFVKFSPDALGRPILPVKIHNPHTGNSFITWGIVDTGADECAIPATLANELGHTLEKGSQKRVSTGAGPNTAFAHTTKIDILSLQEAVLYSIEETPVDFMPNLHCVLLGVRNFLNHFILTIDYPNQKFSIRYPGV